MFTPSALSTNTVAAPPPTPPCGYGKPSDGFRLLLLSGDAAAPPADSDCVHVWSRPLTGPVHSGFRDLLSEEECAAASRFHTPELAERYRQAHGWMRSVLSRYLDTPPETLRFRSGPDSKPGLRTVRCTSTWRIPDSLALLAVRQDAPVGVDVEPVRPLPETMLIACRWFSAPEIRWIAASDDRDRAFLRCWVCREAFLKATGEGLGRPLDSFALHPCGDTLRLDGAALAECTPLAGHVAAVVCETLFPSC
ncbi:MAG: 4'-phosphopantetheinyl transferase family protein [Bilophila wadsworthia]